MQEGHSIVLEVHEPAQLSPSKADGGLGTGMADGGMREMCEHSVGLCTHVSWGFLLSGVALGKQYWSHPRNTPRMSEALSELGILFLSQLVPPQDATDPAV